MPQLAETTVAGRPYKALDYVRPYLHVQEEESLPPLGYMTHAEFVQKCNAEIDNLCKEYGIL